MDHLNWIETDGIVAGKRRRLPTYTISKNEKTGRFLVHDDNNGQLVGAGYASVEEAVKAWQPFADQRTCMWNWA